MLPNKVKQIPSTTKNKLEINFMFTPNKSIRSKANKCCIRPDGLPSAQDNKLLEPSLHSRCTQIKTYSWDNAQVILVGNKCDMEDERVISFERGKQLADSLGLEFYETSAKENINVRVSISPKPNQEGNGPIDLWFQIELIAISFTWLQRDLILYALPSL